MEVSGSCPRKRSTARRTNSLTGRSSCLATRRNRLRTGSGNRIWIFRMDTCHAWGEIKQFHLSKRLFSESELQSDHIRKRPFSFPEIPDAADEENRNRDEREDLFRHEWLVICLIQGRLRRVQRRKSRRSHFQGSTPSARAASQCLGEWILRSAALAQLLLLPVAGGRPDSGTRSRKE